MQDLNTPAGSGDLDFLGSGEMTTLIGLKDWAATPLGPIREWPQSLRTTVSLCLASNFPINIIWGPQHTQIYNDGYSVLCGDEHPAVLSWARTIRCPGPRPGPSSASHSRARWPRAPRSWKTSACSCLGTAIWRRLSSPSP